MNSGFIFILVSNGSVQEVRGVVDGLRHGLVVTPGRAKAENRTPFPRQRTPCPVTTRGSDRWTPVRAETVSDRNWTPDDASDDTPVAHVFRLAQFG